MTHVVWVNKHAPMPKWLHNQPAYEKHHPKQSNTYHVSWRYWRSIWNATPLWATREPIAEIYREAERRRAAGEDVVVDHVVPLRHPLVCGLHWHGNLEIVERLANARKSNHWWPDMPFEQLELFR